MKKILKKIAVVTGLVSFSSVAFAQQIPQYSQFMVNPYLVNPALAGAEDFIDIKTGFRKQWVGFDGAPTTYYLSAHTPIKEHLAQTSKNIYHNWWGVGGFVYKDAAGPWDATSMNFNVAYNMKLSESGGFNTAHHDGIRLSLGTFLGYKMNKLDRDRMREFKGHGITNEKLDVSNDPALQDVKANFGEVDITVGGMIYMKDLFSVGFSTYQALGNNLFAQTSYARHYLFSASYKGEVGDYIYVMPSMLTKYAPGAPVSVDVNVRMDYHDQFFAGLSYRHQDAVTIMAGGLIELKEGIKDFRKGKHRYGIEIFYSYDVTLSEIRKFSSGAHEITAGFRLPPSYRERNAESHWKKDDKNRAKSHRKPRR